MKKLFIFLFVLLSFSAFSQKVVEITAPSSNTFFENVTAFSFSEPVKIVVDVSGIPALKDVEPIYVWAFIQGCCSAPTNGDWAASNEANKMTKEGSNLWSITIPSVKSFVGASYKQAKDAATNASREPQETRFGFLVKAKDGGGSPEKKSGDIEIPFTGPVYIKETFENFPINPAQDDVLTLIYNQDKETDEAMKNEGDVYLYAEASIAGGSPSIPVAENDVRSTASLKLTKNGSRNSITIIPSQFFNLTAEQQITEIRIKYLGGSGNNASVVKTLRIVKVN